MSTSSRSATPLAWCCMVCRAPSVRESSRNGFAGCRSPRQGCSQRPPSGSRRDLHSQDQLGQIPELSLASDGEHAHRIAWNDESIESEAFGLPVRDDELANLSVDAAANQRMCGKVIDGGDDRTYGALDRLGLLRAEKLECALEVIERARRRARSFGGRRMVVVAAMVVQKSTLVSTSVARETLPGQAVRANRKARSVRALVVPLVPAVGGGVGYSQTAT